MYEKSRGSSFDCILDFAIFSHFFQKPDTKKKETCSDFSVENEKILKLAALKKCIKKVKERRVWIYLVLNISYK